MGEIDIRKRIKTPWIIAGVVVGVLLFCCVPVGVLRHRGHFADYKYHPLKDIGRAIHLFHEATGQTPSGVDDLKTHFEQTTAETLIRNGEIEVIWNVADFDPKDANNGKLMVAWMIRPRVKGHRTVVFLDTHIETLTEEEFQKAPKAKTRDEKK